MSCKVTSQPPPVFPCWARLRPVEAHGHGGCANAGDALRVRHAALLDGNQASHVVLFAQEYNRTEYCKVGFLLETAPPAGENRMASQTTPTSSGSTSDPASEPAVAKVDPCRSECFVLGWGAWSKPGSGHGLLPCPLNISSMD